MLEFVFKKEKVKELVNSADDIESDLFVVRLDFTNAGAGSFQASITAQCEGLGTSDPGIKAFSAKAVASAALKIDGCPRPPGCD
jgi:hypothetical protein